MQPDMTLTIEPSELVGEDNPVTDAIARFYDAVVEPFNASLRRYVTHVARPKEGMKVLEIGCGTGTNLELFAEAGCEVAGALADTPLLLFHGDRDELLPPEASHVVAAIAGHGEVVILPGDGHLLGRSDEAISERLDEWLPAALGVG